MGISSKLLLDASGTPNSELDSIYSLNDRGKIEKAASMCGIPQVPEALTQVFWGTGRRRKAFA